LIDKSHLIYSSVFSVCAFETQFSSAAYTEMFFCLAADATWYHHYQRWL